MKISCIIPAYNEESTISRVIEAVKKVRIIDEIIVVDDGSSDNTYKMAKSFSINVVKHEKNKGKGAAIKTGSIVATGDILLFLDADFYNVTPKKIYSILYPLRNDEADLVKTSFSRKRGRVTELVVKPLLNIVMPFIKFNQPLSGQFAIKRDILDELKIDDKWGVDIQILLQSIKKGIRVVEVDIGLLKHKKQPVENLINMSEQVIKTILSEMGIIANKHKLIIFDFDKTIILESSIEIIAREFSFQGELLKLRKMLKNNKIKDSDITLRLANLLKGRTKDELFDITNKLTLQPNIEKVINRLKKRQYHLAIISVAFEPIVQYFAEKLGIDKVIAPILVVNKENKFTGEVIAKTKYNSKCCDYILCKKDSALEIMGELNIKPEEVIAVGDGKSDKCLFNACGLSLSYKPKIPIGDIIITNLSEVLIYAE
jgi:HAD superfamily phosphoserine phosphatase-like hydrolase